MDRDQLTVGQLKAWLDQHDVSDDTPVSIQLVDTLDHRTVFTSAASVAVESFNDGHVNATIYAYR